jgi:hypothetical protein
VKLKFKHQHKKYDKKEYKMKKLLAILLATLAVMALAAGCAKSAADAPTVKPAAAAVTTATTPPQSPTAFKVGGTVEKTAQVDNKPPVKEGGAHFTYYRSLTWKVNGDLEGEWSYKGTTVMYAGNGHLDMDYDSTFTGAVKGKQGTFTAKVTGGSADNNSPMILTATIMNGTGELTNISGTITLNANQDGDKMTGSYTGELDLGG